MPESSLWPDTVVSSVGQDYVKIPQSLDPLLFRFLNGDAFLLAKLFYRFKFIGGQSVDHFA